jgi:hypothetical protein
MRFVMMLGLMLIGVCEAAYAQMPKTVREQPCYWVHGRYGAYIGSGLRRIWIIGTTRIVHMWDEDKTPMPPAVDRYHTIKPPRDFLYGDFKICPLESDRPGVSRHIRIRGARNLIYQGKPFK